MYAGNPRYRFFPYLSAAPWLVEAAVNAPGAVPGFTIPAERKGEKPL